MMTTNKEKLGIYIHIPFCQRKCNYCGFLSFVSKEEERASYVNALVEKIGKWSERVRNQYIVDTVFIGGGTPSLLNEREIKDIMSAIKNGFCLDADAEITIESNPNSLTLEKLKCYLDNGINRLSIGIQSLNQNILDTLGRIHSADEGKKAYYLAREAGFKNINLDLMFAISGQTKEIFRNTLNEVIEMGPDHISFYSLQIEEGTKFYDDYKNEKYEFISDEIMNEMYLEATDILKNARYDKYEISNAAKDGKVCRHNLKYWSMAPFLGIGLGASGYFQGVRYEETSDFQKWLKEDFPEGEKESIEDQMSTYVITGMRRAKGISEDEFYNLYGKHLKDVYGPLIPYLKDQEKEGNLIFKDGVLKFTDKGMLVSNDILCEFV